MVFSLHGEYLKSYDFSGKQLSETEFSIFPYEAIITPLVLMEKSFTIGNHLLIILEDHWQGYQ